ncbi:protein kinase domain-containing protein [Nonomuraea longicatena]|uniref:Protein kinase domain-containing protein n=1 Tax=Nonomuraea longicatena TaxID=83682 RepID=A0ABN1QXW6_9ACTN
MKLAGRYRLLNPLGTGAVRLAFDEADHRDVVVRDLRAPLTAEAPRALGLRHVSIVPLLDLVEEWGRSWLVSEFVSGTSLERTVDGRRPLPDVQAARIGICLLEALTAAHAAGIVHGVLNPGKVLLTSTGRVLLTGFGLPHAGMGPSADLWSLAATLHFAVEGRPPGASPASGPDALRSLIRAMLAPAGPPPLNAITETLSTLALHAPTPTSSQPFASHPTPAQPPTSSQPFTPHPAPAQPPTSSQPFAAHSSPVRPPGPRPSAPDPTPPPSPIASPLASPLDTPPHGIPRPPSLASAPHGSAPVRAPSATAPQAAPQPAAVPRPVTPVSSGSPAPPRFKPPYTPAAGTPSPVPDLAPDVAPALPEPETSPRLPDPTAPPSLPLPGTRPPLAAPHPMSPETTSAVPAHGTAPAAWPPPVISAETAPRLTAPPHFGVPPAEVRAAQDPAAFLTTPAAETTAPAIVGVTDAAPPDAPAVDEPASAVPPIVGAPAPAYPPATPAPQHPPVATGPHHSPAGPMPTHHPPTSAGSLGPAVVPPDATDRERASLRHSAGAGLRKILGRRHRPEPQLQEPAVPAEGPTDRALDQVIGATGPLPPAQVAAIGLAVLDQLTALHARGEHHGDIRPGSILLAPTGRAILAPPLMPNGISAYTAPEGATGPWADLWSLGATLFAAVEGLPPAPGAPLTRAGTLASVLYALLSGDPADRPTPWLLRRDLEIIAGG